MRLSLLHPDHLHVLSSPAMSILHRNSDENKMTLPTSQYKNNPPVLLILDVLVFMSQNASVYVYVFEFMVLCM